jgi:CubicO group peptidase (beta-lactamase class C family)
LIAFGKNIKFEIGIYHVYGDNLTLLFMKIKPIFFLLFSVMLLLSSCSIARFFYWNFADINDYKKFRYLEVSKPETPFLFKKSSQGLSFDTISYDGTIYKFDDFFEKNKCTAFMIIKDDSILYEKYFLGRDQSSYVPSFSAAKSFVSALVGIAIEEGSIKSVQDPITDYIPELKNNDERFSKITIEHLLNMRSGILFKESYFNPFGNVAKSYYGLNLLGQLKKLKIKNDPDVDFEYISENTQILAFIVERATGKKLPEYLQEKIWQPLGMEYDATWSIDSKKHKEAKAFCCLNAVARDYAKFGRLYLNGGNWNGKQIVPEAWVKKSTTIDDNSKDLFYSYQWWHNVEYKKTDDTTGLSAKEKERLISRLGKTYLRIPMNDFFADGLLGQFIYVYPEKNVIIVRLGKASKVFWPKLFNKIAKEL